MIIIVDAYNILKYIYHHTYITERQRTQFIELLVKYGKKRGHDLIVVFDGGPHGLPDEWLQKPVTIRYTGSQERADDVIIRLLNKYKIFDTLIVSTDREITQTAEKNNIPYIDSSLFFRCISAALNVVSTKQTRERAQKMHKEEVNPSLDALMEAVEVPKYSRKDDDSTVLYDAQGKTLSKNERRIMSIVEKL